ncbi:MAG TPA: AtpZ/AtpI family protein [Planctomycetota bacterium]|nr:AtpZ/AtpI family protein [Planctomycetota bacterium]
MNEAPDEDRNKPPRGPWSLVATSLEMAASIGLGVAAGLWLDRQLGWAPWGVIGGVFLGTSVGIYLVMKEAA